jgi:hypothetical protein
MGGTPAGTAAAAFQEIGKLLSDLDSKNGDDKDEKCKHALADAYKRYRLNTPNSKTAEAIAEALIMAHYTMKLSGQPEEMLSVFELLHEHGEATGISQMASLVSLKEHKEEENDDWVLV